MKKAALALALILPTLGMAQTPTAPAPTLERVVVGQMTYLERQFVPLVEAIPEDKLGFAPTAGEFKGVKTFSQQVLHTTAFQFQMAAVLLGEKCPVETGGDDGPTNLKTKAEVVKYAKDSFAYLRKALAGLNDKNVMEEVKTSFGSRTRLSIALMLLGHGFDHYGQMVVYLRMNGLIPPASRK